MFSNHQGPNHLYSSPSAHLQRTPLGSPSRLSRTLISTLLALRLPPRMPTPNPYTLAPTVYSRILEIVPGLHATPPVLPSFISKDFPPSPESGYTLIIHVGVAQSCLVTRQGKYPDVLSKG